MCYKITCQTCQKFTWAGCGRHADSVMKNVPENEKCKCSENAKVNNSASYVQICNIVLDNSTILNKYVYNFVHTKSKKTLLTKTLNWKIMEINEHYEQVSSKIQEQFEIINSTCQATQTTLFLRRTKHQKAKIYYARVSNDKLKFLKTSTQTMKSSKTLVQASARDFKPYWNEFTKEMSQRLFLPTKTSSIAFSKKQKKMKAKPKKRIKQKKEEKNLWEKQKKKNKTLSNSKTLMKWFGTTRRTYNQASARDFKPYWNEFTKEMSQRLFLPTKTSSIAFSKKQKKMKAKPKKRIKQKKEEKNLIEEGILALDPGVRTFSTGYLPSGLAVEWGKNHIGRSYHLCNALDKLQSKWSKERYKMKKATAKRISKKKNLKSSRVMLGWSHYHFKQCLINKTREYPWCKVVICDKHYISKKIVNIFIENWDQAKLSNALGVKWIETLMRQEISLFDTNSSI
ncbi:hypothetical protein Glove_456g23 [Diversispora epigaea]|uniref:Uncharacterized protein n=1 Tax=Diversispora epigaea TaxID=1348612 RepID=A0A397GQ15_9GLOM|nr:hypothetical protein Glove_456g23 [Diversispora epigaea]